MNTKYGNNYTVYADDVALLSENKERLGEMLNAMVHVLESYVMIT